MKKRLSLSLKVEDIIELKVAAAMTGVSVSDYVMIVHQMYQDGIEGLWVRLGDSSKSHIGTGKSVTVDQDQLTLVGNRTNGGPR